MEPQLRSPVVYGPPDISGYEQPTPGPLSITYTWAQPAYISGAQVLGYILSVYIGDEYPKTYQCDYETFTYTVPDLVAGTTYKASIQAFDTYGEKGEMAYYADATPDIATEVTEAPAEAPAEES